MSNTVRARARSVGARFLVAVAACGLATVAGAQTGATATLTQQRDAFRAAYAAAQTGRDWKPLATGLKHYPLYLYLQAAALEHDIAAATPVAIDAYLKRHAGTIPAEHLRSTELRWLAGQKNWKRFLHFYRPGLGDTLTCDALQARLAQGRHLEFERDLAALWDETSLPSACKPVLSAAFKQGLLPPTRVWTRIERAAANGHAGTITQSAAWLAGDAADAARRLAEALRSPSKLLRQASTLADLPRNRDALSLALTRLARSDSAQALSYWKSVSSQFAFDTQQRDRVLAALALYNAVDFGPDALERLAKLPAAAQTDATREWRVRVAVAKADWPAAATALAALTPEEMQHDEWRYWQARVAQKLGHAAKAHAGYSALARQATFYGFLAADRARLPYSICPAHVPPEPVLDRQIEHVPGLARAFEFFAVDMFPYARREWNRAFPDLTPEQQKRAAALATRRGWYDRAIFAFGKSGDLDYYALRFPLGDRQRVVDAAHAAGIDPAWAFAIIRAETAWMPDARSGANARGLMQLLPATAKQVARRNDLSYPGPASLFDPAVNIPLGTRYLAHLAQGFDGSPWLASAAYNAGPGNTRRWLGSRGDLPPEVFIFTIPFNETRDYVTRVLSFTTLYDWRLNDRPVAVSSRMPAIGTPHDPDPTHARKPVVCRVAKAAPQVASDAASSSRQTQGGPRS